MVTRIDPETDAILRRMLLASDLPYREIARAAGCSIFLVQKRAIHMRAAGEITKRRCGAKRGVPRPKLPKPKKPALKRAIIEFREVAAYHCPDPPAGCGHRVNVRPCPICVAQAARAKGNGRKMKDERDFEALRPIGEEFDYLPEVQVRANLAALRRDRDAADQAELDRKVARRDYPESETLPDLVICLAGAETIRERCDRLRDARQLRHVEIVDLQLAPRPIREGYAYRIEIETNLPLSIAGLRELFERARVAAAKDGRLTTEDREE